MALSTCGCGPEAEQEAVRRRGRAPYPGGLGDAGDLQQTVDSPTDFSPPVMTSRMSGWASMRASLVIGVNPVQADRGARVFEAEFGNERVGA